jgi:hypothetical protein
MKKLLLLDADVVIDLHSLGLFEKICKSYRVFVTREVLNEAKYYKKVGYHSKLYPRHLESTFKASIKEGKTLRIHFKRLI